TVTPSAQSAQSAQPRRIDMARDGNDAPLSVRLVIDPKSEQ
ncbi:MAG: lipoprotein localization factor LolB, partial [Cupriavidus sp.]|nr:lipoprotein localization factor LolB [Cupriavidus sp.]